MFKNLAKFSPLALLGVTMSGSIPTLEASDIASLGSTIAGQMGGYITNALMLAGIGLVLMFGFMLVRKIFGLSGMNGKKGKKK